RGGTPAMAVRNPSPSADRFGVSNPPTAREQFPSVSDPSSPNAAASGAWPTPNESHTSSRTRGTSGSLTRPPERSRRLLLARDAQSGPRVQPDSWGAAPRRSPGHRRGARHGGTAGPGVRREVDLPEVLLRDQRVDLRGGHAGVPQQLLHHPDVRSTLQQMGGEGVAQ